MELKVESITRSEIVCRVILGGVLTSHKGVSAVGEPRACVVQKELIPKVIQVAKPVVTATQIFRSMVENPRPSRAEVSEVANAVLNGSDALKLLDESVTRVVPA